MPTTTLPTPRPDQIDRAPDERVNWAHSIPFFLVHVLCFAVVFTGFTTTAVLLFVALFFGRAFFVTAGYHRYFSHKTYKLNRLAEISDNDFVVADGKFMNGWRHGFTLPGNRIGAPRRILDDPRRPDSPYRDFLIEGLNLYADRESLWATITVRADPASWPPDFRLAATVAVAADLCVPVTHDAGLAETLRAEAEGTPSENGRGGLIGRAMGKDAAAAPAKAPLWAIKASWYRLKIISASGDFGS